MTPGRLVRGLRSRGHVVDIVRPQLPADYPNGCPLPVGDRGGEITRPGFQLPNYPDPVSAPCHWRRSRWRSRRPDVVHVATEGPMGVSAPLAAHALNLPVTSSFLELPQLFDHLWFWHCWSGYFSLFALGA